MIYQVSTFLENKPGYLRRITSLFKREKINIRAMTLSATNSSWGILSLIVHDPEKACKILNDNGHSSVLRHIVALEIEDQPGGLDSMLEKLETLDIKIENAYARVVNDGETAFLVVDTHDIDNAAHRIEDAGIPMVSEEIVYGIK
ncbi:MAG: ACT domain-containing protein [Prolixibacteraceae bacterium]|nr:ACT domain-containing protein [Prolixibacteraceae bacterium]